jgi:para-aminobenzoate synthetase
VDAIILSPGPGRPDRVKDFGFASTLIREANIPILGVCLGQSCNAIFWFPTQSTANIETGHQGIGTTFGANIIHAPHIKHGQSSNIGHVATGVLKGLPQKFASIRYNSLVLDFEGSLIIWSN